MEVNLFNYRKSDPVTARIAAEHSEKLSKLHREIVYRDAMMVTWIPNMDGNGVMDDPQEVSE